MGYVMQRDVDKNGDVVETVKEGITKEQWEEYMEKWDDYHDSIWEEDYQMCDITYLIENSHMITLEGARVNVLTSLYRALDDKFIFVITGDGSLGETDEDRCVALNTNYIISIDLKGYENVRDIRRRNKLKFRFNEDGSPNW